MHISLFQLEPQSMELLAQEEQFTAILNDYELKCRVRAFPRVCLPILSIPGSRSYSLPCSNDRKGRPAAQDQHYGFAETPWLKTPVAT